MNNLEKTIIKIIDMKGQILHSQNIDNKVGANHLNIAASDLTVGSYVCRIIQGNKEKNIHFTK